MDRVREGRECRICGEFRRALMVTQAKAIDGHQKLCKVCIGDMIHGPNRIPRGESGAVEAALADLRALLSASVNARRSAWGLCAAGRECRECGEGRTALLKPYGEGAKYPTQRVCRRCDRGLWPESAESKRANKARRRSRINGAVCKAATAAEIADMTDELGMYACTACGGPAEHLDHVWPVAKGGCSATHNLQWLCADCNCRKGAKHPDIWLESLGISPAA